MVERFISARNGINDLIYGSIVKPLAFRQDPERVHNTFIGVGKILGSNWISKKTISALYSYKNKRLKQEILGIKFDNPVGLSAGFDKNAEVVGLMEDVGFGFAEIGSITAKPYGGNPGIRLKRIIERKSIWVNYGLKNEGADVLAEKLKGKKFKIPIGVNVAKTNCRESSDCDIAVKDYCYTLQKFRNIGEYFTLNISCPNAYGGQPFHKPELYEQLLKEVSKLKIRKPIFVKISPDLSKKEVDKIIDLSKKYKINGFVCTNLTKEGIKGFGGYSGKIVEGKANEMIGYIYSKTKGKFVIIGVGGIFSAEDAYRKIKLGANLVELITGMIYNGPGIIGEINLGLVKLMEKEGYENIGEAVGKGEGVAKHI